MEQIDQTATVDRPENFCSDYFARSREPLVALIFIAPMLFFYELGVLLFGPGQVQNGIDACLRSTLSGLGFTQYFLLPLLAVFLLVGWHHALGRPWRLPHPKLFGAMAAECLVLAVVPWILWNVLIVVAPFGGDTQLSNAVPHEDSYSLNYDPMTDSYRGFDERGVYVGEEGWSVAYYSPPNPAIGQSYAAPADQYDRYGPVGSIAAGDDPLMGRISRTVGFFGAGVYEELFFRLILLSLILWALMSIGVDRLPAVAAAVLLSSVLFSYAHYIGPVGDVFDPTTFTFRMMTGAFFAVLFIRRGFGIAAGSHAAYNILVGTILR